MSPVYLNPQQSSTIPFLDYKGDHQLPILGYVQHDHVTSSNINNNYFSCSSYENHRASPEFLAMEYSRLAQDKVVEKLILSQDHQKPNDFSQVLQSSTTQLQYSADGSYVYPFDHNNNQIDHHNKFEIVRNIHNNNNDQTPKKCKPTKLRIMQRTTTTTATAKSSKITREHKLHHGVGSRNTSNETNNNNGLRMCTDCHTTTTPLWRSGPQGPKSLCNACGIRQRKARRAAMAAAAAAVELAKDGTATTSSMSSTTTNVSAPKLDVEEEIKPMHTLPLKKRSKTLNASWSSNINNNNNNNINNNYSKNNNGEKISFEDFAWNSSKNYNSSQRVFPQDEEEGAILLMALSCGLACSS